MNRMYQYNGRTVDKLADVANQYDENGRLIPDGMADPAQAKYSEYLFREAACRFIRENAEQPLFLYYATQLPHGPLIVPDLGPYKDKPWDLKHKEWAAMVHTMDQSVGTIVDQLKHRNAFHNTVIIFASDNGYSQWGYFRRPRWQDDPLFRNKGPWRNGKFICTDGGGRIPLLVSWPRKIASGTSDHITALYDLLATAADLAGVQPEQATDGISLVPLLEGRCDEQPKHAYLYWENGSASRHAQAVRKDHWYAFREHPSRPVQLYDLNSDIGCAIDVAAENADVVDRILTIFKEAHTDSQWYSNPGDSEEVIKARRTRAEREGTLQNPTRANSKYNRRDG
jgi:arylsulfatase A-like enzyme